MAMRSFLAKTAAFLKPKRRWFQFSIRSMLLLTAVFAVWLGIRVNRARQQQQSIAMIQRLGGRVSYDYWHNAMQQPGIRRQQSLAGIGQGPPVVVEPPGPKWLRELIGDEYFINLHSVSLIDCAATDADIELLQNQSSLWCLRLWETKITDAGLQHVTGLKNLAILDLRNAQVTDAGLAHIQALKNIKGLGLGYTQITDVGLECIQGLSEVQSLGLSHTPITDDGLIHLQGMTDMWQLALDGTKITDAGLAHLRGMRKLKRLELNETQITDEGLVYLKGLQDLNFLNLNDTHVSEAGVQDLFEVLPNIKTILRNPPPERVAKRSNGAPAEGESQLNFTD